MLKKFTSSLLALCLALMALPANLAFADDSTSQVLTTPLEFKAQVVDTSGTPVVGAKFAAYKTGSAQGAGSPGASTSGSKVEEYVTDSDGVLTVESKSLGDLVYTYYFDSLSSRYVALKSSDANNQIQSIEMKNELKQATGTGDVPLYLGLREKATSPVLRYFNDVAIDTENFVTLDSTPTATTSTPTSIETEVKIVMAPRTGVYKDALKELIDSASKLNSSDYCYGFDDMSAVLSVAKGVYDNGAVTQQDVNKASADLQSAIDAMIKYPPTTEDEFQAIVLGPDGKTFSDEVKFAAYELNSDGSTSENVLADDITPTNGIIRLTAADLSNKSAVVKLKENENYETEDTIKLDVAVEYGAGYFENVNGEPIGYGNTVYKYAFKLASKEVKVDVPVSGPLTLNAKVVDENGKPVSNMRFGLYKSGSAKGAKQPGANAYGAALKDYYTDKEGVLKISAAEAAELTDYWYTTKLYSLIKAKDANYNVKNISISNEQRQFSRDGNLPLYLGQDEKMTTPRLKYFNDFAFTDIEFVNLDANSTKPSEAPIPFDTEVKIVVETRTGVYKDSLSELVNSVSSYKASDYAQGFESFSSNLATAKDVVANNEATQDAVDKAESDLQAAISGLIKYPPTDCNSFNACVIDESGKYFSGSQTFVAYELDDNDQPTDTIAADNISVSNGILSATPQSLNYKNVLLKLKDNNKYTTSDEFKIKVQPRQSSFFDDSCILSVNGKDVSAYGTTLKEFSVKLSLKPGWEDHAGGVPKGQTVKVADIPVEYTDGEVVEDGFTIDFNIPNSITSKLEHKVFEVKDGKIAGFETVSGYETQATILYTNQKYGAFAVVGNEGTLSMFGRYEGKLPLLWSAEDGADGEEQKLEKILIKKAPTRDESTNANSGKSQGEGVDNRYDDGERPDAFDTTYNTLDVVLQTLPIRDEDGSGVSKSLKFNFFDATTQEFEQVVDSLPGLLPQVTLKKDHHYIVYLQDDEYEMKNMYFTLNNSSVETYPIDDKTDQRIQQVTVKKKATVGESPDVRRHEAFFAIGYKDAEGNVDYSKYFSDLTFKFVSEDDTQTGEWIYDENGRLENQIKVNLIEDIQYMVTVESSDYTIDSFPVTIKNHEENPLIRPYFPYNHFICGNVLELDVIDKSEAHKNDSPITSISGKTTVSGLNFMTNISSGNYLLNDRILGDVKVDELEGQDYEVLDLDMVNMYRNGELSKLAIGDFTVETQIQSGKKVKAVYELKKDGSLNLLSHTQDGDKLTFKTTSMTINNYVIVYEKPPKNIENVVRLSGDDCYGTNLETIKEDIAQNGAPSGVIVCGTGHYLDSLSAAALSGLLNYPILLVNGTDDSINASSLQALTEITAGGTGKLDVILLGGKFAVSEGIESQLNGYDNDGKCERIFGDDGYSTNRAVYDFGATRGSWNNDEVLIASGAGYHDALGAGSYAASKNTFILLANPAGDNSEMVKKAAAHAKATILGGKFAVSDETQQAIEAAGVATSRIAGDDAYKTNVEFVKYAIANGMKLDKAGFSSGLGYYDALGSSHILGKSNSVMFLISKDDSLNQPAYEVIKNSDETIGSSRIFGGEAVMTKSFEDALKSL